MTSCIVWLAVIGAMSDFPVTRPPSAGSQAILLVEDETEATSPFARQRASFVPPWRERERRADDRLPIASETDERFARASRLPAGVAGIPQAFHDRQGLSSRHDD